MRLIIRLVLTIAAFLTVESAVACAHDFTPVQYIYDGTGKRVLHMPKADFYTELCAHFDAGKSAIATEDSRLRKASRTESARKSDLAEVLAASSLSDESIAALRAAYEKFLTEMRRPALVNRQKGLHGGEWRYPDLPPDTFTPTDLDDYPLLLRFLPREFEIYLRGAACYHTEQYGEAIEYWNALLDLPESARPYRSTWAAFMLGRAWQKLDDLRAVEHFERVRDLASQGFRDPLSLAQSSYGWQARIEWKSGNYTAALNHYLDLFRTGDIYEQYDAYRSLDIVCQSLLEEASATTTVAADPAARQIVSLWIISRSDGSTHAEQWLTALAAADLDTPPLGAGRMAWLAYNAGDMERADRWCGLAAEDDFAARWVQAKLLLRAGKAAEAETLFIALCNEQLPYYALESPDDFSTFGTEKSMRRPEGDRGVLLFNQGRFDDAFDAFARGNYHLDTQYVANGVFSADEQQAAVDRATTQGAETELGQYFLRQIRYNYAKRRSRDGEYEKAALYYPAAWKASYQLGGDRWVTRPLSDLALQFVAAIEDSRDTERQDTKRGERLLHAADIARGCGSSLVGAPFTASRSYVEDWSPEDGTYLPRAKGVTEEVERRLAMYAPQGTDTRPYGIHRYWTAALYWDAANLLPDNDPRTARALWTGGKHLAPKDPDAADKFYKALVRRCRKLPIGREADDLRWFPPEPEDWTTLADGG